MKKKSYYGGEMKKLDRPEVTAIAKQCSGSSARTSEPESFSMLISSGGVQFVKKPTGRLKCFGSTTRAFMALHVSRRLPLFTNTQKSSGNLINGARFDRG